MNLTGLCTVKYMDIMDTSYIQYCFIQNMIMYQTHNKKQSNLSFFISKKVVSSLHRLVGDIVVRLLGWYVRSLTSPTRLRTIHSCRCAFFVRVDVVFVAVVVGSSTI